MIRNVLVKASESLLRDEEVFRLAFFFFFPHRPRQRSVLKLPVTVPVPSAPLEKDTLSRLVMVLKKVQANILP